MVDLICMLVNIIHSDDACDIYDNPSCTMRSLACPKKWISFNLLSHMLPCLLHASFYIYRQHVKVLSVVAFAPDQKI